MRVLRLTISQLIAVSLGAVVVLMAAQAAATWLQLAGIGSATSVAEGRTLSMVKGQDLAEAVLRSVALSNAYALTETDGDLAAARAATDRLKEVWRRSPGHRPEMAFLSAR